MDDVNTLPEVTVNGTQDKTDYLTPALMKVFATYGKDTNSPEVQAEVTSAAQRLRDTNPDADDKTLASNLSANLPTVISSVSQTPKVSSGMDEQAQLQALADQRKKDTQTAYNREYTAPIAWGPNQAANADYMKSQNDLAFLPSTQMAAGMKDINQFYTNQQAKGNATKAIEEGAQAGIKTIGDRQQLAQTQNLLDPTSDQNKALRTALTQQLQQMGAPAASIGLMASMNAPQMTMFSKAFTSTEKERTDINLVVQKALTEKSAQAANYGSANASNAAAGASNAQAGKLKAETQGVLSENKIKAIDAEIADKSTQGYRTGAPGAPSTSLESAPAAVFQKYSPKGVQDAYGANTGLLNGLTAGSSQRQDLQNQIYQTLQLVNQGYSGPAAKAMELISPRLQMISKGLANLEAQQQLGQSTAAGSLAASAASPDITKNADTLRSYLANTLSVLQRQDSVNKSLEQARQTSGLGTFDVGREAANTKSFYLPNQPNIPDALRGKIVTLSPAEMASDKYNTIQKMGGIPIVSYHGDKKQ